MSSQVLQISPDVVFEVLDGEAVLLHMDSGVYFRLNKTGTRVWQLLEAREGRETIIETITGEFEAPRDRIEADVDALLSELVERRLVTVDTAAAQQQ